MEKLGEGAIPVVVNNEEMECITIGKKAEGEKKLYTYVSKKGVQIGTDYYCTCVFTDKKEPINNVDKVCYFNNEGELVTEILGKGSKPFLWNKGYGEGSSYINYPATGSVFYLKEIVF